ncbi:hypothetical protein J5N97_019917 [Dioscorea zingiberensis]|uniref:NAC domain-containing protein n=1 Tax=Dioscorea zingiberensis TaxID=325984 RepID=A0A9D5HDB7_9LILI|nr:hypothetical protein J5N97_019917 [Dioscorea zingiberensis]
MHEYELPSPMDKANTNGSVWVICRIKRNKQLEKKRTRYNEDDVSIGDEEFPLLSSQGASKKMACDARGWEQELPVEGVRFDPRIKRNKQLEKKRSRYNEDGVSNIEDEEFSLLSSQGASKKMACHARSGWEQEPVEDMRFALKPSLGEEIMCANNVINEFSLEDFFNSPNDRFMDIPTYVQEESLKQLEMEFRACL